MVYSSNVGCEVNVEAYTCWLWSTPAVLDVKGTWKGTVMVYSSRVESEISMEMYGTSGA